MILIGALLVAEFFRAEVVIELREIVDQAAGQCRHVPRGGDLTPIGQAGCVAESCLAHADGMGLFRHQLGELDLCVADGFGDNHSDVIG